MFTRSLSVFATTLVAAGLLAVTSAMATDEPAPPSQPQAEACLDSMRPVSHLSTNWRRGFRNGVVRGVAVDRGCGTGGAGQLKLVSVSISRKVGKRCQHLMPNGRLGHATSCTPRWLPAKGKKSWTFHLIHKLPRGKYIVATRAVDTAGNVESRSSR
jgi:hypothetical protein